MLVLQALGWISYCSVLKYFNSLKWPTYRMTGIGCFMGVAISVVVIVLHRVTLPDLRQWRWVILRGFCGMGAAITQVGATCVGTPLGDMSALLSIQMALAAIMSRMFLGEELHLKQAVAVCLSIAGATLISQPSFLFDQSTDGGNQDLGYAFALLSGFFEALCCFSGRKSSETSVMITSCVALSFIGLTSGVVLPYVFSVEDNSLTTLVDFPQESIALLVFIAFSYVGCSLTYTAGTQWCPASVSAIASCTATMIFGYLSQMVCFGVVPGKLALSGSMLMFTGVVIMTLSQKPQPTPSSPISPAVGKIDDASSTTASDINDETESLASSSAGDFFDYRQPLLTADCLAPQSTGRDVDPELGALP